MISTVICYYCFYSVQGIVRLHDNLVEAVVVSN